MRTVIYGSFIVLLAALVPAANALEWSLETVDKTGPGRFSTIKIDSFGNAHAVYSIEDGNRHPLRYSFWDARVKRWFTMTVAEGAGICSLALDSKQRPHISWTDAGSGVGAKLRYAFWNEGRWKVEAIPLPSEIIAYYTSIAIGENDRPVISFYEYRGPRDSGLIIRLRTVMWNGEAWELRTVDGDEGSGKFNSVTVDSAKRIHLAYANVSEGTAGLRYATWNGRAWTTEIIEAGYVGYSVYVAADAEGNPHISYVDLRRRQVKLAVRKNGRWTIEPVDYLTSFAYPDRNSVTFDESGRLYLTYYDSGQGILKLARKVDNRWQIETVDGNGAGFTSAVAIHQGILWISYADDATGAFKVARAPLTSASSAPLSAGSQFDALVNR